MEALFGFGKVIGKIFPRPAGDPKLNLEDEDLNLLRMVASGRGLMEFAPESDTEEAYLAFDQMVDRALGLRHQGLVDFTDGMVLTNHVPSRGKYARFRVRGLPDMGRRELARYEPPAEAIIAVVRRKVKQGFSARKEAFARRKAEITSATCHLRCSSGLSASMS